MTCLSFALSDEVNIPIRTTRPYVAIRKHMQEQEMANQEQLAIDLLPQVAETNTPRPMDVAGEYL
jgi:hypothetical protein